MDNHSMIRTQVYLSQDQGKALKALALSSGVRQSALIREAIDLLLLEKRVSPYEWKESLQAMKRMWIYDDDAEKRMGSIRQEFDR